MYVSTPNSRDAEIPIKNCQKKTMALIALTLLVGSVIILSILHTTHYIDLSNWAEKIKNFVTLSPTKYLCVAVATIITTTLLTLTGYALAHRCCGARIETIPAPTIPLQQPPRERSQHPSDEKKD